MMADPKEALLTAFRAIMQNQRTYTGVRATIEAADGLACLVDASVYGARAALAYRYAGPGNMHGWFADLWNERARRMTEAAALHFTAGTLFVRVAVEPAVGGEG